MKKFVLGVLLLTSLLLVGCSSDNKAANINGTWTATLMDTNNNEAFAFQTSIVEASNGTLTISNFSFSTNSSCFVSGETESGAFSLSGDFNGHVSGNFGFSVQSGSPSGNVLTLTGTANGNTITGTWSLTGGAGCAGNGNFTMTRM
jgi:hypothetical protein